MLQVLFIMCIYSEVINHFYIYTSDCNHGKMGNCVSSVCSKHLGDASLIVGQT